MWSVATGFQLTLTIYYYYYTLSNLVARVVQQDVTIRDRSICLLSERLLPNERWTGEGTFSIPIVKFEEPEEANFGGPDGPRLLSFLLQQYIKLQLQQQQQPFCRKFAVLPPNFGLNIGEMTARSISQLISFQVNLATTLRCQIREGHQWQLRQHKGYRTTLEMSLSSTLQGVICCYLAIPLVYGQTAF